MKKALARFGSLDAYVDGSMFINMHVTFVDTVEETTQNEDVNTRVAVDDSPEDIRDKIVAEIIDTGHNIDYEIEAGDCLLPSWQRGVS